MNIDLTEKEFRRLLDLVYIGNWILNMKSLIQLWHGHVFPSRAYEDGGIHEAIADYEDAVFFDILAEELARRDLGEDCEDIAALAARMDEYMDEFEANGVENLTLDV